MKHGIYCVIVTFNPMKWIDRVYSFLKEENILNNTIIVDNGSSDGFVDWVSSKNLYGLVYFQKKNLGFGAANNIGIELAFEKNAKHILLLNQDAWISIKILRN
jgi:GT2 family glycosyltransferase